MPAPLQPETEPLPAGELSPERRDAILQAIADNIVRRRLETPAVVFFTIHKPLSGILSNGLLLVEPMLGLLVGAKRLREFALLAGERENVDRLIRLLEEGAARRDGKSPGRKTPRETSPAATGKETGP